MQGGGGGRTTHKLFWCMLFKKYIKKIGERRIRIVGRRHRRRNNKFPFTRRGKTSGEPVKKAVSILVSLAREDAVKGIIVQ